MNLSRASDTVFMALVIWREARGESQDGQIAVAHSIMNRVKKPSWWGHSVLDVLFKKWQYSSMTDPKDKQLTTWPKDNMVWQQCLYVANGVVSGLIDNPVPTADSYFDDSISPPYWAKPEMFVAQIGRLKFYNVDGDSDVSEPVQ